MDGSTSWGLWLSHPETFMDTAAFLFDIVLCIYLISSVSRKDPHIQSYRLVAFAMTITTGLEIMRCLLLDEPDTTGMLIYKNSINSLTYVGHCFVAYEFSDFMLNYTKAKEANWMTFFRRVLFGFTFSVMVVNVFNNWVSFYEPGRGDYIRGPFYIAFGFLPALFFIIYAMWIHVFNSERVKGKSKFILTLSYMIAISGAMMQSYSKISDRMMITGTFSSVCVIVIFFVIESVDYQKLLEAIKNLDEARKEADNANQAKSNFLATMSHEVRTPMNAILGLDEMILKTSDDPVVLKYAENIQGSGKTLLSIINDILDFSRIESGKYEIINTSYHLGRMIEDLSLMIRMRAEKKGLDFKLDYDETLPDYLEGDEVRIRQILINLLNNAVKYTKEGRVTLRVAGLAEEGEVDLVFSIQDSGVGIKEENIPRLFEAFYRIDEASYKNEEGTGLGLPIVSKLLARMDGEIEIDSEPGEGSSFTVHLKQKILGDTTLESTLKQGRDAGNMEREEEKIFASDAKILVVDDNQINLFVTESLLSTTKAKITTKSGGKEALEILLKEKFDLVFMDHMMPEMNGVDVLHYLQKTQGHPNQNTPIVVLTANAISGTREKYLLEGFTDYISKPVDGAQLLGIMKKYLPAELVKYEEDEK